MRRVVRAGSPEFVKIAGDSSPCAAETSFRELDDVFLQTQTRIWLGEVLHIRFDEETAIADLLANGEFLFQVSKVVWKMLLKKHGELKHSKVYIYERTSSGKSDGRYMPYPKVDSFLKICQILGLTGVDLFSPSDVVEKRDVRRVCMCIRSFSKKARSKNLNVPDFDIVTYTIAMPTDLVGGIRRNLELSQYSSSSSNGFSSSSVDPRELYRQKSPGGQSILHYDSYSETDEVESAFTEFEFQSPISNASYDATNFSNIIGEDSPEGNLVVDGDLSELQTQFRLDNQEQIEVVDKRSIQNGSHELKVALHGKSPSSHTESQIDQGAKACFSNTIEVMSPLRNHKNIVEANNVDTSSYQNFASAYEHFHHDLDERHAIDAEEAFIQSSPTLRRKGLENNLAKCSSSDSVITPDHPKEEFINTLTGPSTKVQTVSCRLVDGDVIFGNIGSSDKNGILEFQDMLHEETKNKINAEGKKDESRINTLQMDPSNSIDEVSSAGNYIKLQADTSELIIHSIDDGDDLDISAKGSVDLEQKVMQNGLKIKVDDDDEVAQVYSISSSISSKDKCGSDLGSVKNDQVSSSQLDSLSGPSNMQFKNNCFSSNSISDGYGNESKFCCSRDGYTLEEGDHSDASMCDLEVDADDQVNNPVMSIMDKYMIDPSIGESNICKHTTFSVSENQLMAVTCNSQTEGSMKPQEKDTSYHRYHMYKNPTVEVKETCTEKFSMQDSSCVAVSSIPQIKLLHTSDRESWEQIPLPRENITAEKEASMSLGHCLIDRVRNCEETEEMSSPDEFPEIHNVSLETTFQDGVSEATFTHDPVHNSKKSSSCVEDGNQIHEILPCSIPACTMEMDICVEEGSDVINQGDIPIIDDVCSIKENGDADGNGKINKEPEECENELMLKLHLSEKPKERAKSKKVLKSVAGAMTLLGALFLVHHVRQKREREREKYRIHSTATKSQAQPGTS